MRPVPPKDFVHIKDDLWRAGNGNWGTLIYVTPEGILLVDPITTDFAGWVKGELARRFPGKEVRYIVYSHSHWDHIGGAAVFADSQPQIVAQERMLKNMDGRFPHFPGNLVDRNNNGAIEPEEMYINTLSHPGICGFGRGSFERADRTPFRPHHAGAVVVGDGGRPAHHGLFGSHDHPARRQKPCNSCSPASITPTMARWCSSPPNAWPFRRTSPADALVLTSLRSMPSACSAFDRHPMAEWIKSFRTIESLNFDMLVQGHGMVSFTKADVAELRGFFEDLRDAVTQGMAQGKSLVELQDTVLLEKYKDWAYYDMLHRDNVEAAYLNIKNYP